MPAIDYDLHKLGWKAFQDLCAVVLQQVLGQTFVGFADTNDAGQDGAFHGSWRTRPAEASSDLDEYVQAGMPVVAQCKFSSNPEGTLSPSSLEEELAKIERLHADGLCDGYLVLTNLRVTGSTQAWLEREARTRGVSTARILPGSWICAQIEQNPHLRRYVPRVYGLGDLARILDDRRLRQARALLTRLSSQLETFVPTDAYRRASDALTEQGFVLLLGEAACGKSTIAAMLSMTALDIWGCNVKRVDGPDELIANWDPDDPTELFWIDDAFGSIRHEPELTDSWTRRFDQVMAAIDQGARVLMTSRDYIYRDARRLLKEYAYPRLREQQVVVNVADLSESEKRQILYNHLKAGDQPRERLDAWRPDLPELAQLERFQPEMARRLSLQAFTPQQVLRGARPLRHFFEHPSELLVDILNGLAPGHVAAMACVYLAGGTLRAPVELTPRLEEAVRALGATPAETLRGFSAIEGTFLAQNHDAAGDIVWTFYHPTIREGFAAFAARDPQTLAVCIDGLSDEELVHELDCGSGTTRGRLIQVPPALYGRVVGRVPVPPRHGPFRRYDGTAWFLTNRCSKEFLRLWADAHHEELPQLTNFGMYLGAYWQPGLLGRLSDASALPESLRLEAVERLREYALEFDPGWSDENTVRIFTEVEYGELLQQIRDEILPDLEYAVDQSAEGYDSDVEPRERYAVASEYVDVLERVFAGDPEVVKECAAARDHISSSIAYHEADFTFATDRTSLAPDLRGQTESAGERDPFDDVADGH